VIHNTGYRRFGTLPIRQARIVSGDQTGEDAAQFLHALLRVQRTRCGMGYLA